MAKLRVLFVAAELTPMAKVGGLGDVVGALPKNLIKHNIDIRVVIPKYGMISEEEYGLKRIAQDIKVPFRGAENKIDIWQSNLPGSEVPVFFIDNPDYLGRNGIYVERGGPEDECHRFTFFARSIFGIFDVLDFWPDIIHCHDWHVGIIPFLEKYLEKEKKGLKHVKTLLTIHNLAYQGIYNYKDVIDSLGISEKEAEAHGLEKFNDGNVRYLGQGIKHADLINTVSPSYAQEILTPEYGGGLEGRLQERKNSLSGILNGIDLERFNPEIDRDIVKKYSLETIEGKKENKKDLQKISKLEVNENIPVIGLVGRMTHQKGIDLVVSLLKDLLKEKVQLAVLATGDEKLENILRKESKKFPDKLSATLAFDPVLAQKIYAGADIFLMPSRFEPCGLAQMIAMRYGTIPVVRATGGLKDTVAEYNPKTKEGTGFRFEKFEKDGFLKAIERALKMFNNKEAWQSLIKNAMSQDYSWDKSSTKYVELYNKLISKI